MDLTISAYFWNRLQTQVAELSIDFHLGSNTFSFAIAWSFCQMKHQIFYFHLSLLMRICFLGTCCRTRVSYRLFCLWSSLCRWVEGVCRRLLNRSRMVASEMRVLTVAGPCFDKPFHVWWIWSHMSWLLVLVLYQNWCSAPMDDKISLKHGGGLLTFGD